MWGQSRPAAAAASYATPGQPPTRRPDRAAVRARTVPQVVERLSDGTGDFSAERMLRQLPEELGIDAEKAARTVAELGGERKRTTLVQVGAGGGCLCLLV